MKTAVRELRSRAFALILLSLGLVIAIHWSTFRVMADIWLRSDTFAHGLIVAPMFLFFVFRVRHVLSGIRIKPFWPGIVLLLIVSSGWIVGRLLGVNAIEQFAAVAMIPLTVLTLAGPTVIRATAFPMLFLFFAVPFGEFLIPQLMEVTADLTELLLLLTGFSVYRDGLFITVPGGDFEIAKACSGIRYLIASIVLGTIFAYLTFNSWRKRLIFLGFSILVPILADGIRAYLIVVLASLSGMRLAVGIDHFIYGWVFFGIVMFVLFGIGVRYRDDHLDSPVVASPPAASSDRQRSVAGALVAVVVVVLAGPVAFHGIQSRAAGTVEVHLARVPDGWTPIMAESPWQPAFQPSDQSLRRAATDGSVTIYEFVDIYDSTDGGVDAASSVNRLVQHNGDWRIAGFEAAADADMRIATVRYGRREMHVATWYQNGARRTTSPIRSKLAEAWDALVRGGSTSAIVAFAVAAGDDNLDLLQQYVANYHRSLSHCMANPGPGPECSG